MRGRKTWGRFRSRFAEVYREGRRYAGEAVVVYCRDTEGPARLAITAGRRLGSAVLRNRAKRRVREAFRRIEGRVCSRGDLVLVARNPAVTFAFDALVDEIVRLCEQGRLLCGSNG